MTSAHCFLRPEKTRSSRVKPGVGLAIFVLALLALVLPRNAFAQYDTASLVGTIRDSSGAAVPNVTVTITNDATGVTSAVKTNGSGDYEVPSLRAGVYTISANASGYAIAEAKSITVSVGARERIDLTLKVGTAQATTVEVSDVALQVETESSQRDQTITGYQSAALPLVSRNYTDLLALVTGVRQAPTQATTTSNINSPVRAGAYNVNGQRSHVQQLPARRHGQQRLWRVQPGLRQSDHLRPTGLR